MPEGSKKAASDLLKDQTVVSFEFSNPSLFNTGTALTYTFVP